MHLPVLATYIPSIDADYTQFRPGGIHNHADVLARRTMTFLAPWAKCRPIFGGKPVMAGKREKKSDAAATTPSARAMRIPLWSRPGYLVRRLHQIHSALWAEECRRSTITPVQYGLMTALLYLPDIDQASLGAEVGIDRTNVADVLARLAERGLVRRRKNKYDRRMMVARLTPAGVALTKKMHAPMQQVQERLLAPLPASQRTRFVNQLTALIDGSERPAAAAAAAYASTRPQRKRNRRGIAERRGRSG